MIRPYISILMAMLAMAPLSGIAQDDTLPDWGSMTPDERRDAWESLSEAERQAIRNRFTSESRRMTPEERKAVRERVRERWDSMTPEQREAAKQKMREKLDSMSSEECEAFRERRRNRGARGERAGQRSRNNEQGGS